MNALKLLTATALVTMTSIAFAANGPSVDTLNVQGYLAQASGQPVSDGTYTFAIAVCQGGVAIWGQEYTSVTTSGGLFTQQLTGLGGDLSGVNASIGGTGCTGANAKWGATGADVTLNAALLQGSTAGELNIRILAVTAIDGSNPQFDVPVSAVPTALVAQQANTVSASLTTATGGVAGDAGLIPVLNGSGQIATTMIPALSASDITSGTLGVAEGGTGQSSAGAALTALGGAASGANADINSITPPSGTLSLGGATTTAVNILPTGANAAIDIASKGTGALTVGGVGTGQATFGNTGAGAVTDITGPTVDLGDASTTAVNLTPSGSNASVTIGSSGSGAVSIGSGTSGVLNVGNASSGNATFGNFGGASETVLQSGTGNLAIAGATQLILPTTAFSITQGGPAASGALTIATTGNQNLLLAPDGTGQVDVTGSESLTGSISVGTTSGNIQLGSVGNGIITIEQPVAGAAWTWTLPPNAGTNNFVLTTNGTGTTTWTNPVTSTSSLNPTGGLTVGGANTTSVTITPTGANASIDVASNGSGTLIVGGAGTGASTFGNTGAGSVTTVTGPTVDIGNVTTTALNLTPSGANAAVDVASNGSGLLTVGGAGTGASSFGNTGAGSVTTMTGPTVDIGSANTTTVNMTPTGANAAINIATNGTSALSIGGPTIDIGTATTTAINVTPTGANAAIDVATNGTGTLTVGGTGTGAASFGNTGAGTVTTVTGVTVDIGNATSTGVNILPTSGNAAVDIASAGSGLLTVGGAGTGNSVHGNNGGTSQTTIQSGSGGIIIDPGSGNAVTVGDTGGGSTTLQSPTVNLGGASLTTSIGTQSTGLTTLNLGGTSTSVLTTTLGGTTGASATTIQSGTGSLAENSSGTSATAIDLAVSGTNGGITLAPNGTGVVTVGGSGTSNGNGIKLNGSTSGSVSISPGATPTAYTITLPSAAPTAAGQVLMATNTTGSTAWTTLQGFSGNTVLSGDTIVKSVWMQTTALALATTSQVGFVTPPTLVQSNAGTFPNDDGSAANVQDNGMFFNTPATAGTTESLAGTLVATDGIFPAWNPTFDIMLGTTGSAADFTSARLFAGIGTVGKFAAAACGASIACSATPGSTNAISFIGFYVANSNANLDWFCALANGATQQYVDSGVLANYATAATDYDLQFQVTGGGTGVNFFINGVQVCSGMSMADLPAVGTGLTPGFELETITANITKVKFGRMTVTYH